MDTLASITENQTFDNLLHSVSITALILMALGIVITETFYVNPTISRPVGLALIALLSIAFLIKVVVFPYAQCK